MKPLIITFLCCSVFFTSCAQKLEKLWETEPVLESPESVVYDPVRDMLYTSCLRKERNSDQFYGNNFISKVDLKGNVVELKWIENLSEPTGICIFNDQLYITERYGIVVYDLKTDKVDRKIQIKTLRFLNDVTVADDSTIYVSESDTEKIYAIKGDEVSTFLDSAIVSRTNGLLFDDGMLLAGVNSDSTIKAINPATKEVSTMAQLISGTIDGIRPMGDDYLVSYYDGNIFQVSKNGNVKELLNTRDIPIRTADIDYIESKKILIIPTLWSNNLIAYQLK